MTNLNFLSKNRWLLVPLLLVTFGISQLWGADVTLTENFNDNTPSSNQYGSTAEFSTSTNRDGFNYTWISSTGNCYVFKNGIKLGANNNNSNSISCSNILTNIPVGTSFTVKVYAAVWGSDGCQITVSYNGSTSSKNAANNAISNPNSVTYNSSHFTNATSFEFTRAKDVTTLTLGNTKKRLIIDKLVVEYSTASCDKSITLTKVVPENGSFYRYRLESFIISLCQRSFLAAFKCREMALFHIVCYFSD